MCKLEFLTEPNRTEPPTLLPNPLNFVDLKWKRPGHHGRTHFISPFFGFGGISFRHFSGSGEFHFAIFETESYHSANFEITSGFRNFIMEFRRKMKGKRVRIEMLQNWELLDVPTFTISRIVTHFRRGFKHHGPIQAQNERNIRLTD